MEPQPSPEPGVETAAAALDPARARALLRKLRDLNLTACTVEVEGGERVSIDGCLSIDRPVEGELRYLLRDGAGTERVLGIRLGTSTLQLSLAVRENQGRNGGENSGEPRSREVSLHADAEGRATAPELLARMDPESSDCREVEHFLRRLVRGVWAA